MQIPVKYFSKTMHSRRFKKLAIFGIKEKKYETAFI